MDEARPVPLSPQLAGKLRELLEEEAALAPLAAEVRQLRQAHAHTARQVAAMKAIIRELQQLRQDDDD